MALYFECQNVFLAILPTGIILKVDFLKSEQVVRNYPMSRKLDDQMSSRARFHHTCIVKDLCSIVIGSSEAGVKRV